MTSWSGPEGPSTTTEKSGSPPERSSQTKPVSVAAAAMVVAAAAVTASEGVPGGHPRWPQQNCRKIRVTYRKVQSDIAGICRSSNCGGDRGGQGGGQDAI